MLLQFIGRRIFSCQKSVFGSFPFPIPIINPGSIRYQLAEYCKMVDAKLEAVPSVDIDPEGIFKYVLIKVYGKEKSDGTEPSKLIVRGYSRAQWHSDIYDEVSSSIQGLGLDTECLGGGRIEHRPDSKKLKVYGYSQGFGKADHAETKDILKTKYSDYNIEISDDGY